MGAFFGFWSVILIAAIAFSVLVVGVPLAIVRILAGIEAGGTWLTERFRRARTQEYRTRVSRWSNATAERHSGSPSPKQGA